MNTNPDRIPAVGLADDPYAQLRHWFETEVVPMIVHELSVTLLLNQGPTGPTSKESAQTPSIRKLLLTKREAAHMLSVSLRTIENQIGRKQLVVRRIGRRVLIPVSQIEQFARRDHV